VTFPFTSMWWWQRSKGRCSVHSCMCIIIQSIQLCTKNLSALVYANIIYHDFLWQLGLCPAHPWDGLQRAQPTLMAAEQRTVTLCVGSIPQSLHFTFYTLTTACTCSCINHSMHAVSYSLVNSWLIQLAIDLSRVSGTVNVTVSVTASSARPRHGSIQKGRFKI